MAVETVVRKKGTRTCGDCGGNMAAGVSKCQNCNSKNIKKTRWVIKKTESTGEDALESDDDVTDDESEEVEDDDEELSEDDFEPADGDEDDDDEEDDDSEDDESDEDDEEEEEDPKVTKRIVRRRRVAKSAGAESVNLDILLSAVTVAEDIIKSAETGDYEGDGSDYERAMTAFNNVCDSAIESWANGDSISKEDNSGKLKRLKAKLAALKQELADSKGGDDDDDVEKSDGDIFKGLTPEAANILREAQSITENNKVTQYETLAKSFGEVPAASVTDLGAALRHLAETNNAHFLTIEKALKSAAEQSRQSDIFKSFGSSQPGAETTTDSVETIAKRIRDDNKDLTPEQATARAYIENPSLYDSYLRGN